MHHLEESQSDNGSIILDLEPQRGDGDGEEEQNEDSKKVDDDEDRSNPQYIPKRGIFYEHDDRTAEDPYVFDYYYYNIISKMKFINHMPIVWLPILYYFGGWNG